MTTTTEEIHVSNLAFIQAPAGFLEKMSTQINRWFQVEAHPTWFMSYGWCIRVNENVHETWVELFKFLAEDPPNYDQAFSALRALRSVRNDYVERNGFPAKIETAGGMRLMA